MSDSISVSDIIAAITIPKHPMRDVSRLRITVTPNIDVACIPGATGKTAHVMSRTVHVHQDTRVTTHVVPGI